MSTAHRIAAGLPVLAGLALAWLAAGPDPRGALPPLAGLALGLAAARLAGGPPAAPAPPPDPYRAALDAPTEGREQPQPPAWRAVLTEAGARREIALAGRQWLAGSHPDCDIPLRSGRAAAYHLRLAALDDGIEVCDLERGSSFVGPRRRRLAPGATARVAPGEPIWAGPDAELRLERAGP